MNEVCSNFNPAALLMSLVDVVSCSDLKTNLSINKDFWFLLFLIFFLHFAFHLRTQEKKETNLEMASVKQLL